MEKNTTAEVQKNFVNNVNDNFFSLFVIFFATIQSFWLKLKDSTNRYINEKLGHLIEGFIRRFKRKKLAKRLNIGLKNIYWKAKFLNFLALFLPLVKFVHLKESFGRPFKRFSLTVKRTICAADLNTVWQRFVQTFNKIIKN